MIEAMRVIDSYQKQISFRDKPELANKKKYAVDESKIGTAEDFVNKYLPNLDIENRLEIGEALRTAYMQGRIDALSIDMYI